MKKLLILLACWASFAHAGLETGTYINDLVSTNPTPTDPKSQGDDHLRLIKSVLQNSFPGFTGSVMVTGTDGGVANAYTLTPAVALPAYKLRDVFIFSPTVGNTGASTLNISGLGTIPIVSVSGAAMASGDLAVGTVYAAVYDGTHARLLADTEKFITGTYAPLASPALTGVPTAPTAAVGTNTTQLATMAAIQAQAFSAALPSQSGNAGKTITTDGTTASWLGASNGNLLIGNGTGFTVAPLTAGTGITITNSSGGITVTNSATQVWNKISTLTANNTALDLEWTGLSGYSKYLLVLDNITGAASISVQLGEGAGPTWLTSGYYETGNSHNFSATNAGTSTTAGTGILNTANFGFGVSTGSSAEIMIYNFTVANAGYTNATFKLVANGSIQSISGGGSYPDAIAKTAIRILSGSGNLTSGTATLYGILQ